MAPPGPVARLLPPILLALAGPASGTFWVGAWPPVALVAFGGSVAINCSHSPCLGGANGILELEAPLELEVAMGASGDRWQLFRLLNVSHWDPGVATCHGSCGSSQANATSTLLVYQAPQKVLLEPVPPLLVGQSHNLSCRVLGAAPVGNLTVTLRRGGQTLHTAAAFGGPPGSAEVAVGHLLTAARGDHGQQLSCHAELSLRPLGPLFARAAAPRALSVFDLPEPPQLEAPQFLEVGTSGNASCRVAGAFPPGEVSVAMSLAQQPLAVALALAGDLLTGTATLSPVTTGQLPLACTAAVPGLARTAQTRLLAYRLPVPALELRPAAAVPAGAEVAVSCRLEGAEPGGARLRLSGADGAVLAEGLRSPLELRLTAARDDDGRLFGCRASLALANATVAKEASARLSVLYPPRLAPSDCPANRTWLRGTRRALRCLATGNPPPAVVCTRRGAAVSPAEPRLVTRALAGTYVCTASNSLGSRSQRVRVRVEYEPALTERGCPSRRTWVEGQPWRLPCRADGDPPPTTRCARQGAGARARAGRAVSRHDAGRYLCRATNRHGAAVRSVTVTVEYEPSLGEEGCPSQRRWVQGLPGELGCAASGVPPPQVSCSKPGAPPQPPWTPNVTRAHAGTYLCQASNSRGTARRNVSVTVDFGPAAVTLRALPSALVPLGSSFRLECGAEGSPPPSFSWELPPAPNLRLGPHNRSVAVASALGANRGLYSCSAGNQHGRVVATVSVRVLESRPGLGATLGALGVLLAALAALGGLQLKRSSGRRGDYNVREAEGAAQRPHNKGEPPEGCGIQLGPP